MFKTSFMVGTLITGLLAATPALAHDRGHDGWYNHQQPPPRAYDHRAHRSHHVIKRHKRHHVKHRRRHHADDWYYDERPRRHRHAHKRYWYDLPPAYCPPKYYRHFRGY